MLQRGAGSIIRNPHSLVSDVDFRGWIVQNRLRDTRGHPHDDTRRWRIYNYVVEFPKRANPASIPIVNDPMVLCRCIITLKAARMPPQVLHLVRDSLCKWIMLTMLESLEIAHFGTDTAAERGAMWQQQNIQCRIRYYKMIQCTHKTHPNTQNPTNTRRESCIIVHLRARLLGRAFPLPGQLPKDIPLICIVKVRPAPN